MPEHVTLARRGRIAAVAGAGAAAGVGGSPCSRGRRDCARLLLQLWRWVKYLGSESEIACASWTDVVNDPALLWSVVSRLAPGDRASELAALAGAFASQPLEKRFEVCCGAAAVDTGSVCEPVSSV